MKCSWKKCQTLLISWEMIETQRPGPWPNSKVGPAFPLVSIENQAHQKTAPNWANSESRAAQWSGPSTRSRASSTLRRDFRASPGGPRGGSPKQSSTKHKTRPALPQQLFFGQYLGFWKWATVVFFVCFSFCGEWSGVERSGAERSGRGGLCWYEGKVFYRGNGCLFN